MSRTLIIIFLIVVTASMMCSASANLSPGTNITVTTSSLSYISPGNSHSSGGSSGGGGSSGVSSEELYSNIAQAARIERDWHYNQTTTYLIPYDITEIVVRVNQSVTDVAMLLNILKNGSAKPAPNGTVYKYFNVYLGSKKYIDVVIKFRVDASTNGVIGLVNFNGSSWLDVPVDKSYSDRNFTYYQAKSTNISPKFAIVVKPIPPTPTPTPMVTGIPKTMPTASINVTTNATPTTPTESPPLSPWIIVIGVIVVLVLVVVYFFTA